MHLKDYVQAFEDVSDSEMQRVYNELLSEFYELKKSVALFEGSREDIQASVKTVEQMMAAAKRGLGISNKLKGVDKKKHNQRVMINMNKLRAKLSALKKQLTVTV